MPNASAQNLTVQVRDLGVSEYSTVLAAMQAFTRNRNEHSQDEIWLTEHQPVFTQGQAGKAEHLLAPGSIPVIQSDRGGQVTYHGPGQLVAYPILDLNRLGLRIHPYMRLLEDVVIETVASFGVKAGREDGATGVWVAAGTPEARKIAALGVRLSRWCSMHGLALNVDPDLSHFDLIVPCGLTGRSVTSLRRELGDGCPSLDSVRQALEKAFDAAIERLTG